MGKYQDLPPLDGPIGAGREEPAALYGDRLFGSSLCGLDRFGLEAGLLLRVARDAPKAGLIGFGLALTTSGGQKTHEPTKSQQILITA